MLLLIGKVSLTIIYKMSIKIPVKDNYHVYCFLPYLMYVTCPTVLTNWMSLQAKWTEYVKLFFNLQLRKWQAQYMINCLYSIVSIVDNLKIKESHHIEK